MNNILILHCPDGESWEDQTLMYYDRPLVYTLNSRFTYDGKRLLFASSGDSSGFIYPIDSDELLKEATDGEDQHIPLPTKELPIWKVSNENLMIWTLTPVSYDAYMEYEQNSKEDHLEFD